MAAPTNAANVKKVLANSEPSTHGGKADMTDANNRWDNLKNKHWNTMGPFAKLGHAKNLKSEKFLTPPLGTFRQN